MKWYKKQLDALKKEKAAKAGGAKPKARHSFDAKKLRPKAQSFTSPVAASKLQRAKTDIR